MNDADRLLEEGRLLQMERDLAPPLSHPPTYTRWVFLSVFLVLVSLAIEIFWPLPQHKSLPACQAGHVSQISCQNGAVQVRKSAGF